MSATLMRRKRSGHVTMEEFGDLFGPLFQRSVGFDRVFKAMNNALTDSGANAAYPPYNIVQTDEDDYVIEMAIVGFDRESVEVALDNGHLTVAGSLRSQDGGDGKDSSCITYLHRGIANRDFRHIFRVSDHIVVGDATLRDGLLSIHLKRELPEALKPRRIEVQ